VTHHNGPTTTLLACLSTTALLASCSQGSPKAGQPNTAPPTASTSGSPQSSGSTTAAASSTPAAPPSRPTAAAGLSLAAGEAFVRYYVDLMNYASQTGDGAPLLAESEAGCEGCKHYADFAAKLNAANGGLSGDYFERVAEVTGLTRGSNSNRLFGSAATTIGSYTTKNSPTAKPVTSKPRSYTEKVALFPSNGNWVMYEIKLQERQP
jgi:hypothetical protein